MAPGETIADKIDSLAVIKASIATALSLKGAIIPNDIKISDLVDIIRGMATDVEPDTDTCVIDRYSATEINIPVGNSHIGNYAFTRCNSVASVNIPSGATSIGNYAFSYCIALKSVTFPNSLRHIGNYAFGYGYSLETVVLPSGLLTIGARAFNYCRELKSLTVPSSVTSIGEYALSDTNTSLQVYIDKPKSEVYSMANYPWGAKSDVVFHCADGDIILL